ncbi:MAG TPA: hypothetical protein VK326_02965, partial [Solirubrobacterales bacterium]|nr:hypothetical protein [Solirubrobacterales bacterium]
MSKAQASPRRVRVEHNIYKRIAANGKPSYEVVYRDSTGVQRHKATGPKISVARAERDSILGRRGSGERVQPNPQLRFSDAADQWLAVQVAAKRPATQASYTGSVESHLRPRWGNRRMDRITTDDAARLIQELREEGKAEATIESICKAARRVFKF